MSTSELVSRSVVRDKHAAERAMRNRGVGVVFDTLEGRTFLSASPVHVAAPHATVRGETLGEYAADWLSWALSAPADQNPLLDKTGQNAHVGQGDKVFFLAGTWGDSTPTTRHAIVPTGTPLFFPVVNEFWVNVDKAVPGVYDPADPPFDPNEPAIRSLLDSLVNGLTGLFTTVDGKSVPDLASHGESDPPGGIQIPFPDNNIFGLPADALGKSATEGIYLMLDPLSPGEHVIHFGGVDPASNFSEDITYDLTVVAKGQYKKTVSPTITPLSSSPVAAKIAADDGDGIFKTGKPSLARQVLADALK